RISSRKCLLGAHLFYDQSVAIGTRKSAQDGAKAPDKRCHKNRLILVTLTETTLAPQPARTTRARSGPIAIVDIGSNSIHLVIYESFSRTPAVVHNEKAICAIGRN